MNNYSYFFILLWLLLVTWWWLPVDLILINSVPLFRLHVVLFLLVIVSLLAVERRCSQILRHEKRLKNYEIDKNQSRDGKDDL